MASLYGNLLEDPSILWPSDSDTANRISQMQRLFARTGMTGGSQQPAIHEKMMTMGSPFGDPFGDPFQQQRGAPRHQSMPMPPPQQAPAVETDDGGRGLTQFADVANKLFGDDSNEPWSERVNSTGKRVDDILKQLDETRKMLVGGYPTAQSPRYAPGMRRPTIQPRAMTPMEGPDTGAPNPNAAGAGAPPGYFVQLRGPEGTKNNYNAVNPTSFAAGPYQFLPGTWQDMMNRAPQLGLTWDGFSNPSQHPDQHDAAIRYFTDQNIGSFTQKFGRSPNMGELYAMHLLGGNGGMSVLSNPTQRLGDLVTPNVISSNPWMRDYVDRPASDFVNYLNNWMNQ